MKRDAERLAGNPTHIESSSAHTAIPFVTAFDAIDDLVLIKGDRSRLLWANQAFLRYYGMSNEQLRDLVDAPHSDPDDTVQYVRDDHHVFTTGETLSIDEPITDSSGSVAFFHTIKNAIRDSNGQIIGTVGVSRRLPEDRGDTPIEERAERKALLGHLRALVQHVPAALAMLDAKQRIIAHSSDWLELFGIDAATVVGEYYDTRHESCIPLRALIDAAMRKNSKHSQEAAELSPSNSRSKALCDVDVQPWFLPTKQAGGTIVLLRDLTRVHESERQQRQLAEEVAQFNFRVSHDLIAPLRTISGLANIVRGQLDGSPDTSGPNSPLHRLESNIDRMSHLVKSLLDLSRIDAETTLETLDLAALIDDFTESKRDDLEMLGFEVERDLSWTRFRTERARFVQILENLLSNAVKFVDPAEPQPKITIRTDFDESGVTLTVEDNGLGFDPNLRDKVFERFGRAHSRIPGSGLGLFLVRRHLEHMDGSVEAVHTRKNTCFEVRLPREVLIHEQATHRPDHRRQPG